jgi:hypothetical protein
VRQASVLPHDVGGRPRRRPDHGRVLARRVRHEADWDVTEAGELAGLLLQSGEAPNYCVLFLYPYTSDSI